jgi:pantetheine-phosphate adenylyltransferase
MTRAVCPGSFDPVTLGHLDVIGRATRLAGEVIVAVGQNMAKNALFTPEERVGMLAEECAPWPGVRVTLFDGLLVDFCVANQASVIVKGLRGGDFDYELRMAQMNSSLTGVDTVFLPTAPQWAFVSSSLVREVAVLGGDVSPFVSGAVARRMASRIAQRSG